MLFLIERNKKKCTKMRRKKTRFRRKTREHNEKNGEERVLTCENYDENEEKSEKIHMCITTLSTVDILGSKRGIERQEF